jgi:hypothetical protein
MTARSKSYVCSIAQACQTIHTFASYGSCGRAVGVRAEQSKLIKDGLRAAAGPEWQLVDQWSATYPAWRPSRMRRNER